MPSLFALGQHRALVAAQSAMHPSAKLMACCCTHLERELWAHAGIKINLGKTQIFNRAGVLPPDCQHIIRAGRQLNPPVVVWRGDSALPPDQRGVTILGTPLGHLDFVKAQLRAKAEEHRILFFLFLLRHKGELLPPHHPARWVRRIRSSPRHSHQQGVQQFVGHPRRPGHFQPCKPSVQVGEAWVCGTQSEELEQRIGPVGLIRCT